jgi:hypothetical protein
MKRILTGCLALVGATVLTPAPGYAATCQRTVTIAPEVSAGEGTGTLTFAVRSAGCTAAGSVSYTVEAGTAQAAVDFVLPSGRLEWGTGDAGPRPITATITPDLVREAELEDFTVRLTDPSPGVRVVATTGRGRILDDDGLWLTLVVDDDICEEPEDCECADVHPKFNCEPVGIALAWALPITLRWSTVDGTAAAGVDFVGVTDQLVTVPAGATRVDLPVRLLGRPAGPHRWFSIRIFAPSQGRIVDGTAVITIEGS